MTETKNSTIHEKLALIQRELKAPKGQVNKFGNYKYRSCEDILEGFKQVIREHDVLKDVYVTLSDEILYFNAGNTVFDYESVVTTKDNKTIVVKNKGTFDRFYVKATAILHDSGEVAIINTAFARESLEKKGMDDSQVTGASSSYARKYALNGLFAIDDTQDSDTMDNTQRAKTTTSRTTQKPVDKTVVGTQGATTPTKPQAKPNDTNQQTTEDKPASPNQLAWVDKRLKANKFTDYKPEDLKFITSKLASMVIQNKFSVENLIKLINQKKGK